MAHGHDRSPQLSVKLTKSAFRRAELVAVLRSQIEASESYKGISVGK